MACRLVGAKPLSEPMMVSLLTHMASMSFSRNSASSPPPESFHLIIENVHKIFDNERHAGKKSCLTLQSAPWLLMAQHCEVPGMMTSSNWNIFRITGPLCGEVTGESPLTKASDAELWCFLWSAPERTIEQAIETPVIWDAIVLILTSLPCDNQDRTSYIHRTDTATDHTEITRRKLLHHDLAIQYPLAAPICKYIRPRIAQW